LGRAAAPPAIRDRDVHTQPKPRLGGAAMFTGFLAAVFIAQQLPALTRGFKPITPEMGAVVMAGFVIVIVGIIDDIFEIDAITKLIGQILGAMVMSLMGLSWTLLYLPFGDGTTVVIDQFQSTVVTALFTVTLINAINFVDGLDGLAAGLGMISGCAILVFALTILHDQGGTVSAYPPAIIAAALVGICLGFLPHNFEPSRIFMGDSGSMLIGLLLAAAATPATVAVITPPTAGSATDSAAPAAATSPTGSWGLPTPAATPATPNPTVATTPGAAAIRRFPTTHPTDRTPAFTGERPASPMVRAWKTLPVIRCET